MIEKFDLGGQGSIKFFYLTSFSESNAWPYMSNRNIIRAVVTGYYTSIFAN
jgi:hypothetical protein